jgi:hypothetical protein
LLTFRIESSKAENWIKIRRERAKMGIECNKRSMCKRDEHLISIDIEPDIFHHELTRFLAFFSSKAKARAEAFAQLLFNDLTKPEQRL